MDFSAQKKRVWDGNREDQGWQMEDSFPATGLCSCKEELKDSEKSADLKQSDDNANDNSRTIIMDNRGQGLWGHSPGHHQSYEGHAQARYDDNANDNSRTIIMDFSAQKKTSLGWEP